MSKKKKSSSKKSRTSSMTKQNTNAAAWSWGELEITLQSDICLGNGYAFFGTIDTDVEYDCNGLPFLPGRRLKGVLRENADFLYQTGLLQTGEGNSIEEIFGCSNAQGSYGIQVENGCIKDWHILTEELNELKNEKGLEKILSRERVLALFTSVKAQTRMKDGVADNNSLRFTRVINQYSAMEQREDHPLQFTAQIRYKKNWEENLKRIAKATRNLGMNRNRGLGSVVCVFRSIKEKKDRLSVDIPHKTETIRVFFKNLDPLIISGGDKNGTLSFIPGRTIAGALAGSYLLREGTSGEDEAFFDLFLNGKTKFSDFTISDGNEIYCPAPFFLNTLKKTEVYVNTLHYSDQLSFSDKPEFDPGNGNQPKKLRGKYVNLQMGVDGKGIRIVEMEPQKKIIFHHRRGKDALLYSQTALDAGQIFAGTISYPKERLELLQNLLKNTNFILGKSKTAQYGRCQIIKIDQDKGENQKIEIKAGAVIYVSLASPGIFQEEAGITVEPEKVYQQIAGELGLEEIIEAPQEGQIIEVPQGERAVISCPCYLLEEYIVHGYQSIWNLPRAVIPCIQAGSVFIYKIRAGIEQNGDKTLPYEITKSWVGKRNLEGYGKIQMFSSDNLTYDLQSNEKTTEDPDTVEEEGITPTILFKKNISPSIRSILALTCQKELYDQCLSRLLDKVTASSFEMSASALSRITLMLTESMEQGGMGRETFRRFWEKVDSIKGEKDEITSFLRRYFCTEEGNLDREKFLRKEEKESCGKEINRLVEILAISKMEQCHPGEEENGRSRAYEIIESFWGSLLMEVLSNQKYLKKFSASVPAVKLEVGGKA